MKGSSSALPGNLSAAFVGRNPSFDAAARESAKAAVIRVERNRHLPQIIEALHAAGGFTTLLDGRQQQAQEHANDRDHDQQLDERHAETRPPWDRTTIHVTTRRHESALPMTCAAHYGAATVRSASGKRSRAVRSSTGFFLCVVHVSAAPVPRRALQNTALVGLLTSELGAAMPSRRVLSRQWLPFRRNICDALAANRHPRTSVTAAGPSRIYTGVPCSPAISAEIAGHQCTIHAAGYQVPSRPSIKFSPRTAQHADCSRFIDCIARRDPARRLTYNWRIISFRNSFTRSRCFYVRNRRLHRPSRRRRFPDRGTAATGVPRLRQRGRRHDHVRAAIRLAKGAGRHRPPVSKPGATPAAGGSASATPAGPRTDRPPTSTPIRTSAATATVWRGPQRRDRKLPRAQRAAAGRGLRLSVGDRHRGHRPSDRQLPGERAAASAASTRRSAAAESTTSRWWPRVSAALAQAARDLRPGDPVSRLSRRADRRPPRQPAGASASATDEHFIASDASPLVGLYRQDRLSGRPRAGRRHGRHACG